MRVRSKVVKTEGVEEREREIGGWTVDVDKDLP